MAAVVQLVRRQEPASAQSPLTPQLREFIDHVIVPILVKEYLALEKAENELAKRDSHAANSVSTTAAQEQRTVRP